MGKKIKRIHATELKAADERGGPPWGIDAMTYTIPRCYSSWLQVDDPDDPIDMGGTDFDMLGRFCVKEQEYGTCTFSLAVDAPAEDIPHHEITIDLDRAQVRKLQQALAFILANAPEVPEEVL